MKSLRDLQEELLDTEAEVRKLKIEYDNRLKVELSIHLSKYKQWYMDGSDTNRIGMYEDDAKEIFEELGLEYLQKDISLGYGHSLHLSYGETDDGYTSAQISLKIDPMSTDCEKIASFLKGHPRIKEIIDNARYNKMQSLIRYQQSITSNSLKIQKEIEELQRLINQGETND